MSQLLASPQVQRRSSLSPQNYSVDYSAEHLFCNKCSSENFPLNAPKFIITTPVSVVTFNILPLSGQEMAALAIFFRSAGISARTIHFDQVPGFRITSKVSKGGTLELLFQADSDLLHFMGHIGSASLVSVNLTYTQLTSLADQVLDSAATCNN